MNDNNLKPFNAVAARENGHKGGIASGKARQERKKMKEHLLDLLSNGNIQENILLSILDKAQSGDIKAAEFIRDTIGEKPSDKHELTSNTLTQALVVFDKSESKENDDTGFICNNTGNQSI